MKFGILGPLQVYDRERSAMPGPGPASGPAGRGLESPGPQLLTVMFTDVVSSTDRLVALGDRPWRKLIARYYELASDQLRRCGGRLVKTTGDGILSVFAEPAQALHCARQLDYASRELELDLRAGMHAGECELFEDDVAGLAVHIAARITDLATAGDVLVSSTVCALVADSSHRFVDRGTYWLKGVPGEWAISALAEPAADAERQATRSTSSSSSSSAWETGRRALPLPSRLDVFAGQPFVGREGELGQVRAAITSARGGEQAASFLAGEPGIGKTRLTAAVCQEAHAAGCYVLYGRCEEDLGLPMQPFVEALEHLVEHAPPELLRRHVAARGGELALLVPHLARRVPALPVPRTAQEDETRHLLLNAVASLLAAAAEGRGLVLVLDDLHWADHTTILVLRHLLMSHSIAGVAVIATYRDNELPADHPLTRLLADVITEPGVARVALGGLGEADVALLLEGLAGHALGEQSPGFARRLREDTGGNPLFVVELLRALVESGEIYRSETGWTASSTVFTRALPSNVREVILRRVRRLEPSVRTALSTAAVIGREFDLELLHGVSGIAEGDLLDALETAINAHLLQEVAAPDARFTFTHAVIEYTLYEALSSARRRRLHERIAEAIEATLGPAIAQRSGELAYHWAQASASAHAGAKALHYAEGAGEQALARLAFTEAVGWFRRSLELLGGQPPIASDPRAHDVRRAELTLRLGVALHRAGDADYGATLLAAAQLARELGETDLLVAAALANTRGVASQMGRVDRERVGVLEAALEAVGEDDSRERAELLSMLTIELLFDGDHVRRRARSDEALAIARRVGDRRGLMQVLTTRSWAIDAPDTLAERLANLNEAVIEHGEEDDLMVVLALRARAAARLEAGDIAGMEADAERCERVGAELHEPLAAWWAMFPRLQLTMLRGQLRETERLTQEFLELGLRAGQSDALTYWAAALVGLRQQQGRTGEMLPLYERAVTENPAMPAWSGGLALGCLAEGDRARARELLRRAGHDGFAHMPRDWVWLVGVCMWAEVAARLEDRDTGTCLYELLMPWRELVISTGAAAWGTVIHHLSLLAVALGLDEQADEHLNQAATLHAELGAPVWLGQTQVLRARMLLTREGVGAARSCGLQLHAAVAAARSADASGLERDAVDLLAELGEDTSDKPAPVPL
jgi:class 3 adenylate cyclase